MLYDGGNLVDVQRAEKRLRSLIKSKKVFELTEKKVSQSQVNYLHLIINFLAVELGLKAEYVKEVYYKRYANEEIYKATFYDQRLGIEVDYIRSSKDLTKDEMTTSIERLRNFASIECDTYLPAPDEEEYVKSLMLEVERHKQYI